MAIDTTSEAWAAGVAMGERHATTGDCHDYSDERWLPLTAERDETSRSFDSTSPLGNGTFNAGYEYGYGRIHDAR